MPAYADTVGAGAFTIGLLIAAYDFAEVFAKPIAGLVADRSGTKRVLLLGSPIFTLALDRLDHTDGKVLRDGDGLRSGRFNQMRSPVTTWPASMRQVTKYNARVAAP